MKNLAIALIVLLAALTAPAGANAASCRSWAAITSDIWGEHQQLITSIGCLNPAGCTAAQLANLTDQLITFWNTVSGDWVIGPKRLDLGEIDSGIITGTFGRLWVTLPLVSDEVTIDIQELDGKGKTSVKVCKHDVEGNHIEVAQKWFNDTNDRQDKEDEHRQVVVSNASGYIITVHFDGKSVANKFRYEITAADLSLLEPANLMASSISSYTFDAASGEMTFHPLVQNTGDEATPEALLGFYLSEDDQISVEDHYLGGRMLRELQPGNGDLDAHTISPCDLSSPFADVPFGTYYVGLIADFADTIPESDESDNWTALRGSGVTVETVEVCPHKKPDLALQSTHRSYDKATETVTFETVVKNIGAAKAERFKIGYYLSEDDKINANDTLLGEQTAGPLFAGEETSKRTFSADLCDAIDTRRAVLDAVYYVGWVVDFEHEIDELDESNNRFGGLQSLTVTCL